MTGQRTIRRVRQLIVVPNPALGADWTITVPGGQVWHLFSIYAELVAGDAAANRVVAIMATAQGRTILNLLNSFNLTAGVTWLHTWAYGTSTVLTGARATRAIPDVVLGPGGTISVSTTALDSADRWQNIRLYAETTMFRAGSLDRSITPDAVIAIDDLIDASAAE